MPVLLLDRRAGWLGRGKFKSTADGQTDGQMGQGRGRVRECRIRKCSGVGLGFRVSGKVRVAVQGGWHGG